MNRLHNQRWSEDRALRNTALISLENQPLLNVYLYKAPNNFFLILFLGDNIKTSFFFFFWSDSFCTKEIHTIWPSSKHFRSGIQFLSGVCIKIISQYINIVFKREKKKQKKTNLHNLQNPRGDIRLREPVATKLKVKKNDY